MDTPALRMTVFDGSVSQRGYVINRFAKSLTTVAGREAFAADPHAAMTAHGMTAHDIALVDEGDWLALLDRGASIYLLAKIAIARGGTLMEVGAQMRGQTPESFAAWLEQARAARR